jgi:YVTN family beta-propeller protein
VTPHPALSIQIVPSRPVVSLRRSLWVAAIAACGGDGAKPPTEPTVPPVGSLRVVVTTRGPGRADPLTYTLDGGTPQVLSGTDTLVLNGLAAGAHSLLVGGVSTNCTLDGTNPRAVTVPAGRAVDVTFSVTCAAGHPAGSVSATLALTSRPYGVAISGSGVALVAQLDLGVVSRIDVATGSVGQQIAVGYTPSHVAFNPSGTTAYVANQGSRDVSVVDVATNRMTASIPVASDAWNVIVSADGAWLYATTDSGLLYVIDTSNNAIVATVTLRAFDALRGLALAPDGRVLYVAGRNSGTIYAFDTQSRRVTRTFDVGGTPQRMAVSPDGAELYVANEVSGLEVVTLATGVLRIFPLGGGYGLAMSPDAVQLYMTVPGSGLLQIFDRATLRLVKSVQLGGRPRVVAFTPAGDVALVTNEAGWVTFVR